MKKRTKKVPKKRRVPIVGIGAKHPVEISFIEVEGGKLVFKDETGKIIEFSTVTVGDAYIRTKKPKVLRQLAADPSDITLNTKELLKQQDVTLVVDTNCHDFGDFRLCVSSSILIMYETKDGRRLANLHRQADFVFCTNCDENPERFAWWDLLSRFTSGPMYDASKNFGLTVDSDLRDLPDINSGRTPVWDQNFLPPGFQILYASADVGAESYINQAMRQCHKRAEKTLSNLISIAVLEKIRASLKPNMYFPIHYLTDKGGE
jgi:hypothetical protein